MKEWFSGIVRGKTTDSRGKDKKVRHLFIVDATGFTEAENVLVADKFPVYKEPKVISLKREAIEAVYDECDTESAVWWLLLSGWNGWTLKDVQRFPNALIWYLPKQPEM